MSEQAGGPEALERVLVAVAGGLAITGPAAVRVGEDGGVVGELGGDGVERLTGRDGEVIDALQYLAAQVVRRAEGGSHRRVVIDAAGYRARREELLRRLAVRAAEEALEFGEEIELDPMSPHDRRIVHMALAEREDVETRSEGEEPRRRIVVAPADDAG
ncbi:MAG: hypothetical protein MUE51_03275 [Thermoleophilia bacterium]|jgi:spoIIIJ-associated protein|nr:hypothetical protein [Thermoleophilia bacterium]